MFGRKSKLLLTEMENMHEEAIYMNMVHDNDQVVKERQKIQDELFELMPVGLSFNYMGVEYRVFNQSGFFIDFGTAHSTQSFVSVHYRKFGGGELLEKKLYPSDIEWLSLAIKDTSK